MSLAKYKSYENDQDYCYYLVSNIHNNKFRLNPKK